jgi:acetyl esterase/lipase
VPHLNRRSFLNGAIGLAALGNADGLMALSSSCGDEVIPLWPGTPPGVGDHVLTNVIDDKPSPSGLRNRRLSQISTPMLVVKRPPKPNGAAMIVVPGGGYSVLNYDLSGEEPACWLNERGITAFILIHRLPGEGWSRRATVPLQDAQRAIRLVRAHSQRLGIDRDRVGVLGFSAGGHVAGSLITRFAERVYDPVDAADALSARPDLAALLFPVISMGANAHVPSRTALLGANPSKANRDACSLERHVPKEVPPTFLCCAGDDAVVPPVNSLAMYLALLDAGGKAELHMFQKGGHGFALRLPESAPASGWPDLMLRFARFNAFSPAVAS